MAAEWNFCLVCASYSKAVPPEGGGGGGGVVEERACTAKLPLKKLLSLSSCSPHVPRALSVRLLQGWVGGHTPEQVLEQAWLTCMHLAWVARKSVERHSLPPYSNCTGEGLLAARDPLLVTILHVWILRQPSCLALQHLHPISCSPCMLSVNIPSQSWTPVMTVTVELPLWLRPCPMQLSRK